MKASLLLCMLLMIAVNPVVAEKKKKGKVHHDPADDEAWLAKKSKEEGVVTLESGLMYKVLKSGKAWARPDQSWKVQYQLRWNLDATQRRHAIRRGPAHRRANRRYTRMD